MSHDSAAERLEELEALLEKLALDNEACPILVEGEKDVASLRELGLQGEILRVKGPASVFAVCEHIAQHHKKVILLVDWDRGGGHLAHLLQDALDANGVKWDGAYRRTLAAATRKEVLCVEDLAGYLEGLRGTVRKNPRWRPRGPG